MWAVSKVTGEPVAAHQRLTAPSRNLLAQWRRDHSEHFAYDPAVQALYTALDSAHATSYSTPQTADPAPALWMAYQPIVELADGRMVAVEALIRPGPTTAKQLPDAPAIIDAAERSGLIVPLGAWVMGVALAQVRDWRTATGVDLHAHINASPLEVGRDGYLQQVIDLLDIVGLPASALVIEVTESAELDRDGAAQHSLLALSNRGIDVALDDFGTRFASLDLLADTPARVVKLDRSFITALGDDDDQQLRGRAIVTQAAVGMARSLGLQLVGEGIETAGQARTLLAWGCQFGQGYLYGRPVAAQDLDLRPATSAAHHTMVQRMSTSPDTIDLGVALARVLAATDDDGGTLRAMAMQVATIIAASLKTDRRRAESASLLASIADVTSRLSALIGDKASISQQLNELLERLEVAPVIRRDTPAGAIARTAWAVAASRCRNDAQLDPALLAAHPDPTVDDDLRRRVDQWWESDPAATADVREAIRSLEAQLSARQQVDDRLRSFVGLARAIGASGSLPEVLTVVADEARQLIGAAVVAITRWDFDAMTSTPVCTVGDRPVPDAVGEPIGHDRFPISNTRVGQRLIHFEVRDQLDGDPGEQSLLVALGTGSSTCVPIIVDDQVWGVFYASTALESPAFTLSDGPMLSAVANFVAAAITRVENVARLSQLATEDPLTGAANRQRLVEHLQGLLADRVSHPQVTVIVVTITNLKQVNRTLSNEAGDRLLCEVADWLTVCAATVDDAIVGRLGGDELCIAASVDLDRTLAMARHLLSTVDAQPDFAGAITIGVSVAGPEEGDVLEVIARAVSTERTAQRRGVRLAHAADLHAEVGDDDAIEIVVDEAARP